MSMKTIILVAIASLCIPQWVLAQGGSEPSFYPLAVSDFWQYDSFAWGGIGVWDTTILQIHQDSTFDGHSYAMIAGSSLRYRNTWQSFERVDPSGDIYRGDPGTHQESLLYRLSDTSGSWWNDGSSLLHRFDSCGTLTLFGSRRSVLYVGEYSSTDTILQNQRLLLEGVGYYTTHYFGAVDIDADILHGARIDGLVYGTITSVQRKLESASRTGFELGLPRPNPFNPSTTFTYSLSLHGRVQICILDILGRVVDQIVDEVKRPGTYTAKWHATSASSGLYICRMTIGNRIQTQKLVLMK